MVIIVHFKAKPWLQCKLKRQQLCQCQNAFYTNVLENALLQSVRNWTVHCARAYMARL